MRQPFEVINANLIRGGFRAVVFDFDGTLSLLREGWARTMAELGRDHLAAANLVREPEADLLTYLEREMLMLSGKPSIFQMRRLSEEVASRGGAAPDPDAMLVEFLKRLVANIQARIDDLKSGAVPPSAWTVSGTHAISGVDVASKSPETVKLNEDNSVGQPKHRKQTLENNNGKEVKARKNSREKSR